MTAQAGGGVVLSRGATDRIARLVANAKKHQRDLMTTIRGEFVAMPEFSRWHRDSWMARARRAKREELFEAALSEPQA